MSAQLAEGIFLVRLRFSVVLRPKELARPETGRTAGLFGGACEACSAVASPIGSPNMKTTFESC